MTALHLLYEHKVLGGRANKSKSSFKIPTATNHNVYDIAIDLVLNGFIAG